MPGLVGEDGCTRLGWIARTQNPDSSSLGQLMALTAPVLAPFRELLRLRAIDVYGSTSDAVAAQLRAKDDLLGGMPTIHRRVGAVETGVLR
jgi:hypothetical protein